MHFCDGVKQWMYSVHSVQTRLVENQFIINDYYILCLFIFTALIFSFNAKSVKIGKIINIVWI